MTDILNDLRDWKKEDDIQPIALLHMRQAADEIERLRKIIDRAKEAWDWYNENPHDRCGSVVYDALHERVF